MGQRGSVGTRRSFWLPPVLGSAPEGQARKGGPAGLTRPGTTGYRELATRGPGLPAITNANHRDPETLPLGVTGKGRTIRCPMGSAVTGWTDRC